MLIRFIASAVIAALMMGGVTTPARQIPEVTAEAAPVTQETAEALALEQAGLTAEEVTRLRSHLDREDGALVYEVEFSHAGYEYDYTVQVKTGKILDWDREYEPDRTPPATMAPAPTEPAQPELLTADQAKAIAFAHAEVTEAQIRGLEVEADRERGVPVYDIEFRQGNWEFSYEIDRNTGAILDWEKDWDD